LRAATAFCQVRRDGSCPSPELNAQAKNLGAREALR
jgi:hypothetical protein